MQMLIVVADNVDGRNEFRCKSFCFCPERLILKALLKSTVASAISWDQTNDLLGEDTFNRAKLLNVGYTEALKDAEYDCFIFSDVDLIPMDDRNLYHCYDQPRHFAIAMDKFGFRDQRLPYAGYFGGVSGLSKKQFLKINGFPNEYWGWGGEDDDIYNRITLNGMKVSRPDVRIGRYRMIKHERDKHNEPNPQRFNKIQNTKNTMRKDGISSLTYRLVSIKKYPLYTNISVEIGKPPPRPIKG
ncbi:hypothetical protein MHYP_G00005760 [Metynnis hypsauchen]